MKERKLNYRFHNPNTAEVTIDYILKVFIQVNEGKVKSAIQAAAESFPDIDEKVNCCKGHPA